MAEKTKRKPSSFNMFYLGLSVVVLCSAVVLVGCGPSKLGEPGKTVVENDDGSITTTITTTTTSTTSTKPAGVGANSGCRGSYIGSIVPPPREIRIANRNRQLLETGFKITGDDAIDNKNTGGGGVDGGMYLQGSFAWETDKDCKVIKGSVVIFGYDFPMSGTVDKNRTFTLSFLGPVIGAIDANNKISGQVQDGGQTWIYGELEGTFTPRGKI